MQYENEDDGDDDDRGDLSCAAVSDGFPRVKDNIPPLDRNMAAVLWPVNVERKESEAVGGYVAG
jgi:hypothetical protein